MHSYNAIQDTQSTLQSESGAHQVCVSVSACVSGSQVKNLRSSVSRVAVCTLGVLYCHLERAMDPELEATAKALLHRVAQSNAFIRQEVDATLGHMVRHCTPERCIIALLVGGLRSGCSRTRMCARTQRRHTCRRTRTHTRFLLNTKNQRQMQTQCPMCCTHVYVCSQSSFLTPCMAIDSYITFKICALSNKRRTASPSMTAHRQTYNRKKRHLTRT